MGISSFVRSLFDPEAMGEQIIISIQDLYEKTKKLNPADDPHIILSMTYFARVRARIVNIPIARKIDPNDPNTFTLMLAESLLFACLPEGHNIRALALKILQEERPDIWERYPKFEADAQMRVGALVKQIESGKSIFDLYKIKNSQLQIAHLAPVMFDMLESGLSDILLTGVGSSSTLINPQSKVSARTLETLVIDSSPKLSPSSADETGAAQILLKHDDNVKSTIQGLDGLPKEVVEQVLVEIVRNPNENPKTVRNRTLLFALGRPDMEWSDEFDLIVRKCKDAGIEDVREFFSVFPVLSKRMAPIEVFRKLIAEKVSNFHITAPSGKQILVTQYGTNSYTFQTYTGQKTLGTIEEVYEFFGIPNNKRM